MLFFIKSAESIPFDPLKQDLSVIEKMDIEMVDAFLDNDKTYQDFELYHSKANVIVGTFNK